LLKDARGGDMAVLELDSWQLQGFGDLKISPHISVFTTFMPDHMNYYNNSMSRYFKDKANIFKYQNKNDFLVLGKSAKEATVRFYNSKDRRNQLSILPAIEMPVIIPKNWKPKLIGKHNLENIGCAVKVADILKIPRRVTKKVIEDFESVEGRLQLTGEYKGISFYNDTNSTTPDATLAGIKALSNEKIILIMGGSDKNLDMSILIKEAKTKCKAIILLDGSGTQRIFKNFDDTILLFTKLKDAFKSAVKLAQKGDIVLFSPAFASFGMFKNEYDRGDQFIKLVKKLK
jgi:UDP-N-acetylmuramoylalanine--D-glutamate ligase